MKINKASLLFSDFTEEEAKEMQQVATGIMMAFHIPSPLPVWVHKWFEIGCIHPQQEPLMISQVLPGRILLSILLQRQRLELDQN